MRPGRANGSFQGAIRFPLSASATGREATPEPKAGGRRNAAADVVRAAGGEIFCIKRPLLETDKDSAFIITA